MQQITFNSNGYIGLTGSTSYLTMIQDFQVSASTKAYYKFHNNLLDGSGSGYNLISGATTSYNTQGVLYPSSILFTGATSYIYSSNKVIPVGKKTISMWMKSSHTATYQSPFGNGNWEGSASYMGFSTYIAITSGLIVYQLRTGATNAELSSTINICDGLWRNLIFTWDGTTNANQAKLYINGALDNQGTFSATEGISGNNLYIGKPPNPAITYYLLYGNMQELIMEDRVWSAAEILSYYQKYRPI